MALSRILLKATVVGESGEDVPEGTGGEAASFSRDCLVELGDDVVVLLTMLFWEAAGVAVVFMLRLLSLLTLLAWDVAFVGDEGDEGDELRFVSDKTESMVRVSEMEAGAETSEGAGDDVGEVKAEEEGKMGDDGDEAVFLTPCL